MPLRMRLDPQNIFLRSAARVPVEEVKQDADGRIDLIGEGPDALQIVQEGVAEAVSQMLRADELQPVENVEPFHDLLGTAAMRSRYQEKFCSKGRVLLPG